MALPSHGNVGGHARSLAGLHVGFAVIAVVGQQRASWSERFGQFFQSLQLLFQFGRMSPT